MSVKSSISCGSRPAAAGDRPAPQVFEGDVLDAESALIVPAISILEVFKWVLREHSEAQAIQAVAAMQRGQVVDLDISLAIAAAQFSHTLRLPMVDSIILATARIHQARLYTMDTDYQGLNDVELMAKHR